MLFSNNNVAFEQLTNVDQTSSCAHSIRMSPLSTQELRLLWIGAQPDSIQIQRNSKSRDTARKG